MFKLYVCILLIFFIQEAVGRKIRAEVKNLRNEVDALKNTVGADPIFLNKMGCDSRQSIGQRKKVDNKDECPEMCRKTKGCVAVWVQFVNGIYCWLQTSCFPIQGPYQNTELYITDRQYLMETLTKEVSANRDRLDEPVFMNNYSCITTFSSKRIRKVKVSNDHECKRLCQEDDECVVVTVQYLNDGIYCWLDSACFPPEGPFQNTRVYYTDKHFLLEQMAKTVSDNTEKIDGAIELDEYSCISTSTSKFIRKEKVVNDYACIKLCRENSRCVAVTLQYLDAGTYCWLDAGCYPPEGKFQNTKVYYIDRPFMIGKITELLAQHDEKIAELNSLWCLQFGLLVGHWSTTGADFTDISYAKYGMITGFEICTKSNFIIGLQFKYGHVTGPMHGVKDGSDCQNVNFDSSEFINRVKGTQRYELRNPGALTQISLITNVKSYTFGDASGKPYDVYKDGNFLAYITGRTRPTGLIALGYYFYC